MPYRIPAKAGQPYRPSNGTEGAMFQELHCDRCSRDEKYQRTQDAEDGCPIIVASMFHEPGEPGYPSEWTHDDEGQPVCRAFHMAGDGPQPILPLPGQLRLPGVQPSEDLK